MEPCNSLFLGSTDKGLFSHSCSDSAALRLVTPYILHNHVKVRSVLAAVTAEGKTVCSFTTPVISVITKGSCDLSGAAAVANCGVSPH